MSDSSDNRTVEKLLRQQAALAAFGSFAFRETDLLKILTEAARLCATSLEVPFSKVCRYLYRRAMMYGSTRNQGCFPAHVS